MAMAMAMTMTMTVRDKLKALCSCSDGWAYAVFWRFHPQNSLMLTMEEAYYEEQLGQEIANLLPQVHLLGEGIVGEAAFTGKHSWVHSDIQTQELNFTGQNISEDDSGLHQQFSSGIKTVVVIPVKACGAVQFGSKKKILETVEFLEQTQRLLMEIESDNVLQPDVSGNEVLSLEFENYDLDGLLDSFSTEISDDWNLQYAHDEHLHELNKVYSSSASSNDLFASQCNKIGEEVMMTSFQGESSCISDLLKDPLEGSEVLLNSLIDKNPCFDSWTSEVSSLDLLAQQFGSEITAEEVPDVCFAEENAFSSTQLPVQDSALTSLDHSVVADDNFPLNSDILHGFSENFEQVDISEEFLKFSNMDDLCQWFAPSALDNTNLSESIEFNPSSSIVGSSSSDIPMTSTINSDGIETSAVMHSSGNNLLDGMEFDLSFDQPDEWWGNMLAPVVNAATSSGFSQCLPELNIRATSSTGGKRLFSELGIEELLKDDSSSCNPFNSSDFGYGLSSSKRQIVEFSPMNRNPLNVANLSGNETSNLLSKKDSFPKSQVLPKLNDDRHNIHIRKDDPVSHQKQKEHAKPAGRGARPKENSRPRPKDRQQIQDCIQELRGLIPCSKKCSIDSLLDHTIRHMIFLRSVMKYKDKLQEPHEPKLINQANGEVLNDTKEGDRQNNGVTCAFEVADQTMVCPIIVEDMSQPGHLLVEMVCEEQGFFLEIVDIIKGFGLKILKGKMEKRKNKLWSRFIVEVEANRHVTRIDVFWSLLHFLQQKNTSGVDYANNNLSNAAIDAKVSYLGTGNSYAC